MPTGRMFVSGMVHVNGRTTTFANDPALDEAWPSDALLFRAERQVVVRVDAPSTPPAPPDDPGGRLAPLAARGPRGADRCG